MTDEIITITKTEEINLTTLKTDVADLEKQISELKPIELFRFLPTGCKECYTSRE